MNAADLKSILFLCVVGLFSCQDDLSFLDDSTTENFNSDFPNVESPLWPYFERFEKEAATRGIIVDLVAEQISGTIEPIDQATVVGTCSYGGFSPGRIVIDSDFWSRASTLGKEMIIFHELGHCFLHRDHKEGRRPDGSCVSIMRSGLERCRDAYSSTTKPYYLDELFSISNRSTF